MKAAICPRCGKSGICIGNTPLPDGNGAYDQYRCLNCGNGFMLPERPGAAPAETEHSREGTICAGAI